MGKGAGSLDLEFVTFYFIFFSVELSPTSSHPCQSHSCAQHPWVPNSPSSVGLTSCHSRTILAELETPSHTPYRSKFRSETLEWGSCKLLKALQVIPVCGWVGNSSFSLCPRPLLPHPCHLPHYVSCRAVCPPSLLPPQGLCIYPRLSGMLFAELWLTSFSSLLCSKSPTPLPLPCPASTCSSAVITSDLLQTHRLFSPPE